MTISINAPRLVLGQAINFTPEFVHTIIRNSADLPGSPALRMLPSGELVPNTKLNGHIIFLDQHDSTSDHAVITELHIKYSRALCTRNIRQEGAEATGS